jgi:parallel beta-helix repeat protein
MPLAAHAATYHVATNGNDSNSGTSSSPWRTLQKAANTVRAGDVVLVANGAYTGFQVTADGTASAPIVFRANGDAVVVNARNASTADNINLEGANYVTVEGFVVNDAPRNGIRAVTATGVIIRGNVVSRSGLTGILTGFTPRIQIIDNIASDSEVQHGIYVSNSNTANDDPVIRGNECFGNNNNGIQINGDCVAGGDGVISGGIIENNVVHHNNWKGFSMISLQNSTIRNNLVHENGISAGAGAIHLADEPGCGKPSSNNVIVNNTIHEPRIAGIRITHGSGNTIFNNLVVAKSLAYTITDEAGGNFIDPVSNLRLTSVAGLFVNPGAGDYHLLPASPALERGVFAYRSVAAPSSDREGTSRPQGLLIDTGADESGTATGVGDTPAPRVTIERNVPNPFNASTQISVDVPAHGDARVTVHIYDVRGRLVRRLADDVPAAGLTEITWDGRTERGHPAPSGIYLCQLSTGAQTATHRMTLLR